VGDRSSGSGRLRDDCRLKPGDVVRVKRLQGAQGAVERDLGDHPDPEVLAYQQTAPAVRLFRVRFEGSHLFPERSGSGSSTVTVDLYEHWLERVG
jgi:hypothetical protein